ncbi:DUF1064 domain-containing protein [bacterium]|nr:DUF1064 domain-containing protein [bacterium]
MKRLAKKALGCEDCGGEGMSKYGATRLTVDGETFDSKGEHKRYADLLIKQRLGEIRNLQRQPKFPLAIDGKPILIRSERYKNGRQVVYTADFQYDEQLPPAGNWDIDPPWHVVIEDFKGYDTTESRLRRAVFEAQYGKLVKVTGAQKMRR